MSPKPLAESTFEYVGNSVDPASPALRDGSSQRVPLSRSAVDSSSRLGARPRCPNEEVADLSRSNSQSAN